uniref:Uncharacterized protein n=1 Tax=Vespula pensylvanica TaxID=30213 RepID=A0A834NFE9_VESPE|nr:hypothetical protein H0235_014641 [Vespula pensylvanica]
MNLNETRIVCQKATMKILITVGALTNASCSSTNPLRAVAKEFCSDCILRKRKRMQKRERKRVEECERCEEEEEEEEE